MVEEIGLDAIKAKVKRPLTDLRVGPFYGCYIVRPTDRLGIDEEHPRDRYLQMLIEALGGTVVDYAGAYKCCGFPIITMNKEASLKQAGTPPRRRGRRGRGLPRDAVPAVPPQPRPPAAAGRAGRRPPARTCRSCTCRSSSASPSGLDPKELGLNKHVVKPTSVIDWSTSVVAGVGAGDDGAPAAGSGGGGLNEKEGACRALSSLVPQMKLGRVDTPSCAS